MTISFLFFILIYSAAILEKGVKGLNLDLASTAGYIAAYSIPVVVLEILLRKLLRRETSNLKIHLGIYSRSVFVALLSTFLWALAIFFLPDGEDRLLFLLYPIAYCVFAVLNVVLSVIFLCHEKGSRSFRKASIIIVLSLSFVSLVYGEWLLSKCDWQGCGNRDYLVQRAIEESNPAVCQLAGRTENSVSPRSFFFPSRFRAWTISDCYWSLGVKTNNRELCSLAGYSKDICYEVVRVQLAPTKRE